jgi:hypothetical protein
VRVLLVGVGRWGEKHLRVLRALGAEVGVAERSADRRAWAERQGLPPTRIVSDVRAALDAEGFRNVQITVSGGFDPGSTRRRAPGKPSDDPQIDPSAGLTAMP